MTNQKSGSVAVDYEPDGTIADDDDGGESLHEARATATPAAPATATATATATAADEQSPPTTSTRQKLRHVGHEAKEKTKRLVGIRPVHDDDEDADGRFQSLHENPAFDPAQLLGADKSTFGGAADKTLGTLRTGFRALVSPKRTVQRKAGSNLAVKDRPYLSKQADLEYLEAHDKLVQAQSRDSRRDSRVPGGAFDGEEGADDDDDASEDDDDDVELQSRRVHAIDSLRESRRVAWTTSRHIQRVGVIAPHDSPRPDLADYQAVDAATGQTTTNWTGYLGERARGIIVDFAHNSMGNVDPSNELAAFSTDSIARQAERLIVASSPWQSFAASLRELYLWKRPWRSGRWLATWLLVWYLDRVATFAFCYVVYRVLEYRFFRREHDVAALRESYERATSSGVAAFRLNELIHRHGDDWLGPALEIAGPRLQLGLSDAADFLEVLRNFYEWRDPRSTWATLFWFACATALGAATDTGYCVKVCTLFAIATFFLGRPVASRAPRYRHVVNPLEWIWWSVPSDAQWSVAYLQREAVARGRRRGRVTRRVDGTVVVQDDDDDDYHTARESSCSSSLDDDEDGATASTAVRVSFKCHWQHRPGWLLVSESGLAFRPHAHGAQARIQHLFHPHAGGGGDGQDTSGSETAWSRPWSALVDVEKTPARTTTASTASSAPHHALLPRAPGKAVVAAAAGAGEGDVLRLGWADGSSDRLTRVRKRDKAFNTVVGVSGSAWRVLRPEGEGG